MPELPEVETIKRKLEKYLVGHRIQKIEVRYKKSFPEGKEKLIGGRVEGVRRFGKALSIDLDNNYSALIHIKMTGQLIYQGPNIKRSMSLSEKVTGGLGGKHTHVIFYLDKKGKLYYNDVRKFGWIKAVKKAEVEKEDFIKMLGPEPFRGLTVKVLKKILKSTGRSIKVVLMDQTKIAGVGNIYANDALWLAKINPKNKANTLTNEQIKALFNAIIKVMRDAIKRGGASDRAYVTPDGQEGKYQEHFLVYGKKGEKCDNCKKIIKKEKIGGRGTYYCPNCQK